MIDSHSETEAIRGFDMFRAEQDLDKRRALNSLNLRRLNQTLIKNVQFTNAKQNSKIRIASPDLRSQLAQPRVLESLQSNDSNQIEQICAKLVFIHKSYPNFVKNLNDSEEIIGALVDAINSISTESCFNIYCQLALLIVSAEKPALIDTGILFAIREFMNVYPETLLGFYIQLPQVSSYARSAMICTGVVDDIIECCQQTGSQFAAQALHSIFSYQDSIETNNVEPYLTPIIGLLETPLADTVYFILLTIIDFIFISSSFIHALFELKIHVKLYQLIQVESLMKPVVALVGSLACSELNDFKNLIDYNIIQTLIVLLHQGKVTCEVYWALTNCVEAAANIMMVFFDDNFFQMTASVLVDCPFPIMKDVVHFVSTLLLFAPENFLPKLLSYGLTTQIFDILDCSIPIIIDRCLNAISRILFFANTDHELWSLASIYFQSDDLMINLEELSESESQLISSRARIILTQLDSIQHSIET